MESTTPIRLLPPPVLGESFNVEIPANSHQAITVAVIDASSPGTFTPKQLADTVWSLRFQALYQYNRCPWVERDYSAPIADVVLVAANAVPAGAWVLELLDTSDQPGAIGYHEDKVQVSKEGASGVHSTRGHALHPATGEEIPLSKVFCKTAKEDAAPITEVASHEMGEMAVDPWVMDESKIRKYLNPTTKQWWIGEVGDPVQGRTFDVGAPYGRPCGVPEALVSDLAYPSLWGQPQTRPFTSLAAEFGLAPNLAPFTLSPGGYMSVSPEAEPTVWSQIYGADHPKAEAKEHAYECPGDTVATTPCVPLEGREKTHKSDRQLLELLPIIYRKVEHMEDVLAGLAADEAELATIVPKLVERDEAVSKKLAEFEAKAAAGEVVPASEVEALKSGFDASVTSLKALLPAEPGAPAQPTKAVYTHTGEGAIDASWTPSGFETVPVAAAPAVPADPTTGAPETPEVPAKPAEPLYYFSGDTGPGTTTGAGPEWTPYTGAVQAVPAA